MGGVTSGRDALELVAAGANAVALGTVLFGDPRRPARIRAELAAEAPRSGLADPADARGVAHADGARPDRGRGTSRKYRLTKCLQKPHFVPVAPRRNLVASRAQ